MKYMIEIDDEDEQKYVNPISRELMIPNSFGKNEWTGSTNTGIMLTPYKEHDTAEQGWELAQKIDDLTYSDWKECFGEENVEVGYINKMSYLEAKTKYEAWKKRKGDKLEIGDVVVFPNGSRLVIYCIFDDGHFCGAGINANTENFDSWGDVDPKGVKKVGHFDEIRDIMREVKMNY